MGNKERTRWLRQSTVKNARWSRQAIFATFWLRLDELKECEKCLQTNSSHACHAAECRMNRVYCHHFGDWSEFQTKNISWVILPIACHAKNHAVVTVCCLLFIPLVFHAKCFHFIFLFDYFAFENKTDDFMNTAYESFYYVAVTGKHTRAYTCPHTERPFSTLELNGIFLGVEQMKGGTRLN